MAEDRRGRSFLVAIDLLLIAVGVATYFARNPSGLGLAAIGAVLLLFTWKPNLLGEVLGRAVLPHVLFLVLAVAFCLLYHSPLHSNGEGFGTDYAWGWPFTWGTNEGDVGYAPFWRLAGFTPFTLVFDGLIGLGLGLGEVAFRMSVRGRGREAEA